MAIDRQTVCVEIRAWLRDISLEPDLVAGISDDGDLLAEGVIDSFGMLDLLTWIDERYGVFIEFGDGEILTQIRQLADRVVADDCDHASSGGQTVSAESY